MTFSKPFLLQFNDDSITKRPSEPSLVLKVPIEKDLFVNQIQIIPKNSATNTNMIIEVVIGGISIFTSKQLSGFFINYEMFEVPLTFNELESGKSIDIYVWGDIVTSMEIDFVIQLSEANSPIVSGSLIRPRSLLAQIEDDNSNQLGKLVDLENSLSSLLAKVTSVDTNADGIIDEMEIANVKNTAIQTAVESLDLDDNGIIDEMELAKAEITLAKTAIEGIDPVFWTKATGQGTKTMADGGSGMVSTIYTVPTGKIAIVKVVETRARNSGSATKIRLLIRGQRIAIWANDTSNPYTYNSREQRSIFSDGTYPEANLKYADLQGEELAAGETIAYDGDFTLNFNASVDYAYTIYERDA